MSRSTVAISFGWFCGAMTQIATDSFAWGLTLAALSGVSFGIAERIWDAHNTGTSSSDG